LSGERVHVQVMQRVTRTSAHLRGELRVQQRGFTTASGRGMAFGLRYSAVTNIGDRRSVEK
jgi:hypothetical protein